MSDTSAERLLVARGLAKSYQTAAGPVEVLRDVDLEIRESEMVAITGASGVGKSTLLHLLGMLDGEWGGEYNFLEHAVHDMKVKHRNELHKQHIGFTSNPACLDAELIGVLTSPIAEEG